MLLQASPDQFEILSDIEVRHAPTGAVFSVHRYDWPTRDNVLSVLWVYRGEADQILADGVRYAYAEIVRIAGDLLLHQAIEAAHSDQRACA
jgi:hypothetical protein